MESDTKFYGDPRIPDDELYERVRNIIEKMEVIAKDKLTIWFIGDIAYEIEIPELKVQEKY